MEETEPPKRSRQGSHGLGIVGDSRMMEESKGRYYEEKSWRKNHKGGIEVEGSNEEEPKRRNQGEWKVHGPRVMAHGRGQ
jgi:hypothetical protein